jgi:hypothetical protein
MSEPLNDPAVVIELVRLLPKAIILARIDKEHDILLRASSNVVQLHALMPVDRSWFQNLVGAGFSRRRSPPEGGHYRF